MIEEIEMYKTHFALVWVSDYEKREMVDLRLIPPHEFQQERYRRHAWRANSPPGCKTGPSDRDCTEQLTRVSVEEYVFATMNNLALGISADTLKQFMLDLEWLRQQEGTDPVYNDFGKTSRAEGWK